MNADLTNNKQYCNLPLPKQHDSGNPVREPVFSFIPQIKGTTLWNTARFRNAAIVALVRVVPFLFYQNYTIGGIMPNATQAQKREIRREIDTCAKCIILLFDPLDQQYKYCDKIDAEKLEVYSQILCRKLKQLRGGK